MSSNLEPPQSEQVVALQHLVQRTLGRCLIRLQQYERLAKAMVAEREHQVSVPAHQVPNMPDARMAALSKKTLGHVVGELTETVLTPDSIPSDQEDDEALPLETNGITFRTKFRIELPTERHDETVTALRALVDLRNELVHHFLERHDIWSERGCISAQAYLDACYEQVDARYMELKAWAKGSLEACAYMASFVQSSEFKDFLFHGILPGGAGVAWASSTIVSLLREAETNLADNGWTPLDKAITLIRKTHPEHVPKRYGCSSWRQVLHESREFQVRKTPNGPGLPTRVWYRSDSD